MVSKEKIVESEMKNLKEDNNGVLTFSLDDLVMMQMVGNFDGFIEKVKRGNQKELDKEISQTKETATTPQLFESIVRKTIESQFAEKHITLRELGQNGIDAYHLNDLYRFVDFSFEPFTDVNTTKKGNSISFNIDKPNEEYYVLRVRDYGVGMNLANLVKDLLIPYNSGKEFDLTKIGEHGIGWYSIVDLAEVVKVVTRERLKKNTVHAIVHREGEKWKAAVKLDEEGKGFTKNEDSDFSGTEVVAYIKADQTNKIQIENYLHQYLGLVDTKLCRIKLDNKIVNSISELYNTAIPTLIDANGESKPLKMGVSKRALGGITADSRFEHRDKNLSKIVYTQNGLFVKFDGSNFHEDTLHKRAMDDLLDGGLDFWVDLPDNITLTKRRNEVIADESPLVLKAMYDSFEGLFLDVLLNDDELMQNYSGSLQKAVSNMIAMNGGIWQEFERKKYSWKRRTIARSAWLGSKTIDLTGLVLGYTGKALLAVGKFPFKLAERTGKFSYMCLEELVKYVKENSEEIKKDTIRSLKKWVPVGVVAYPVLYGAVKLYYEGSLWKYLGYGAGGILAVAAAGGAIVGTAYAIQNWKEVKEAIANKTKEFYDGIIECSKYCVDKIRDEGLVKIVKDCAIGAVELGVAPFIWMKEKADNVSERIHNRYIKIMNWAGFYLDVEEKRRRKLEKKLKKISKKYISKLNLDEFTCKITNKKIIPARYYFSEKGEEQNEKPHPFLRERHGFERLKSTWKEWFGDFSYTNLEERTAIYGENQPIERYTLEGKIEKELWDREMKISINELIELYISGKLRYGEKDLKNGRFSHGEYFVDENNPIVKSTLDKLSEFKLKVHDIYDVKVLEDYLDNLIDVGSAFGYLAYLFSGAALIHLLASVVTKKVSNPFTSIDFYVDSLSWLKHKKESIHEFGRYVAHEMAELYNSTFLSTVGNYSKKVAIATAKAPVTIPWYLMKGIYNVAVHPAASALNPSSYPEHYSNFKKNYAKYKAKKEQKRLLKESKRAEMEKEELKRKELEKTLEKTSWTEYFGRKISNSKMNPLTWWPTILGKRDTNSFKGLKISSLEKIVNTANQGQVYVDFFKAVQGIENLISEALDVKPSQIKIDYFYKPNPYFSGFSLDKGGNIRVNLQCLEVYGMTQHFAERLEHKKIDNKVELDYLILDLLIHYKAHKINKEKAQDCDMSTLMLKAVKNQNNSKRADLHSIEFYKKKSEVRAKVAQHILNKGISLEEYVDSFARKDKNMYYSVHNLVLRDLVFKSRNQLIQERIKTDQDEEASKARKELRKSEVWTNVLQLEDSFFSKEHYSIENGNRTLYSICEDLMNNNTIAPEDKLERINFNTGNLMYRLINAINDVPDNYKVNEVRTIVKRLEDDLSSRNIENSSMLDSMIGLTTLTETPVETYFIVKKIKKFEMNEKEKKEKISLYALSNVGELTKTITEELIYHREIDFADECSDVVDASEKLLSLYFKNTDKNELFLELKDYAARKRGFVDGSKSNPVSLLYHQLLWNNKDETTLQKAQNIDEVKENINQIIIASSGIQDCRSKIDEMVQRIAVVV